MSEASIVYLVMIALMVVLCGIGVWGMMKKVNGAGWCLFIAGFTILTAHVTVRKSDDQNKGTQPERIGPHDQR